MLIDEKAWGGGGRNGSLSGVSAWLDWPRWRAMAVDEIVCEQGRDLIFFFAGALRINTTSNSARTRLQTDPPTFSKLHAG